MLAVHLRGSALLARRYAGRVPAAPDWWRWPPSALPVEFAYVAPTAVLYHGQGGVAAVALLLVETDATPVSVER